MINDNESLRSLKLLFVFGRIVKTPYSVQPYYHYCWFFRH